MDKQFYFVLLCLVRQVKKIVNLDRKVEFRVRLNFSKLSVIWYKVEKMIKSKGKAESLKVVMNGKVGKQTSLVNEKLKDE